jgi:DNA helicase II / ATP-dependent DNA helicase PcrA
VVSPMPRVGVLMTPADLASYAVERSGYAAMLQAEGTAEAQTREENLAELIGSIRDYEAAAQAEGADVSLAGFLEKTALINVGDDIKTDDAVTLMTVHAAKGLEYNGVMIVGLEDELFPNKGFKALDDDGSTEADDLEEERRLAYVAITRARRKLILSYAAQRTLYGQTKYNRPSRFLKDLPKEDIVQVGGRDSSYAPRGWGNAPPMSTPKRGEQEWRHPMWASNPPRNVERTPGERFVERDDGELRLREGVKVRHKKFGEGSVVEIVEGPEPKVVADFPGWGQMTILQRFVQIVD